MRGRGASLKMTSYQQPVCYDCQCPIKFDKNQLSPKGKPIPLELDGRRHQCPYKPQLSDTWGFGIQEYRKLEKRQVKPEQSTLTHDTTEDSLAHLEEQIGKCFEFINRLQQQLQQTQNKGVEPR